ncbi:hypothetical protein SAMN05444166_7154 [Singulisphaera sp. GP187]|uniref:hypothetical protein n=1 Tax=Singulisphaera sp. GP187 TaxID=1882752 RepID=UPI000926C1AC|nr:hypothetical protein [Singulisphaera sp. GP187]SIO62801.1 hypothetical protein SAMN05444166_7154 [Singulisphaera sp. GP187]
MVAATDPGGRGEAEPRADAPRASSPWSIPEIRVVKDDQGRLRIDQADPATYGAYAARQLLATAEADPRYRDGMTKRVSASSIKITYVNDVGEPQKIGVREIFCRMDGDALVLTRFENSDGEKVKDLPIAVPLLGELDDDVDDADRLHELALAELGDVPLPPAELEPEPEEARPAPARERRLPTGPLRKYDEATDPAPAADTLKTPPAPEPAPLSPAVMPPVTKATTATIGPPAGLTVRALDDGESASLRALIEAKAGQTRWANGLLIQAAERHPNDRRLQNEHLANLLRVSLDPSRAESRTPLATALRGIIEEVHAHKAGVLDRDPLKAEKVALQPFARTALGPTSADDGQVKTVSGSAQRTPAQILAKLEDPKLARATRVKLLLEAVPELIESWRPDKESGRSEAGNENSPAIVRRLFTVANEQRQQRRFIDNGSAFKKAGERYAGLEGKLPKSPAAGDP